MLILAAILAILVYGLVAPILGSLLPSYHFTGDQNGTLGTIQALGLMTGSLAVGPIMDIKGKKPALIAGLLLVAISLGWAPNAGGYGTLLFVYFILGIGGATVVTGANALVGGVNEAKRGSALNFLNLFFGLGGIATPFLSGFLQPAQLCYVVAGLTIVALLVNSAARVASPSGVSAFKISEAFSMITKPSLLLLSIFLFLYVSCEVGVWNWLKTYLTSSAIGIDDKTASNVVGFGFAFGILVGRIVVSRILMKVPAITVTLVFSVFMAITTLAMLQFKDPLTVAILVFFAGCAMAPMFPTALAMVGDAFPRGTASAMGIATTFGWLGLAVSSRIIGAIAGPTSDNLKNGLLLLPLFSVLMVLVSLALRPMLKRHMTA